MLVPPHYLVSTAFKKMRWKDEFRKWLPKLSIIIVQQKNARTEEASVFFLSHREQQQQQYTHTAAVSPPKERITITGNIIFFCLNSVSASRWMTDCCSSSFVTCSVCLSVFCAYFTQHSSTYIHPILILLHQ